MILVFDLCLEGHGESVTAHKRDRCSLHRETWDESGKLCWQYTRSYNCNLLIEWNIPDPFANWYRKAYAHSGKLSIPNSHTNHKSSTEKMLRREDRWTQMIMDKEDKWRRMIACGDNNNYICTRERAANWSDTCAICLPYTIYPKHGSSYCWRPPICPYSR